ncbi:MAG: hypothetical protein J6J38_06575 [Lachnospiraceae bacterium]|nr:hypothetical protein [Lachnospiraceae bacterium]
MKGCIINYDETSLNEIFDDIESFDKYNLLITNMECYPLDEKMSEMFSNEYCWIEGKELLQLLKKEEFQWIWGVFSVFSKEITLEEVLKYKYPYADGYSGFWKNPITIQHPLATTEIVAWDGSKVLVISKKEELANTLLQKNVSAKDLEEYNQS